MLLMSSTPNLTHSSLPTPTPTPARTVHREEHLQAPDFLPVLRIVERAYSQVYGEKGKVGLSGEKVAPRDQLALYCQGQVSWALSKRCGLLVRLRLIERRFVTNFVYEVGEGFWSRTHMVGF